MNNTIPGTVCCLLCRGMVIYKEGDKSRFKAHMNNEHGAFFDIDYLLASCLLESDQKEAVAKTVKTAEYNMMLGETNVTESGVTLREESSYNLEEEERDDQFVLKKEKSDYPPDVEQQCGSCGTQFGTQEAFVQHNRRGCKKEESKKKNVECDQCGKYYTSKQSLRAHKEKQHNVDPSIKQERYDDPSMDPGQLYQQFPEDNEMETNDEGTSFVSGDYEVNTSSTETEHAPTNEAIESNDYSRERDLDQFLNEVRKRNEDVLQESADDSINSEDNVKADNAASGRFECQVESCGRSYTAKSNRQIHEKKAHNIISARAKNKKFKSSVDQPQDVDLEGQEKESNLRWDELEKIRAQYYNNPAETSTESIDDDQNAEVIDDGYKPKTDEAFITDTSMDFNETQAEDQATNQPTETATDQSTTLVSGLDTSQSKYFTKNPKVITSARGKSLALFNEIPVGLSEDWKMRSFEVTTKTGAKSMIKHYLTPELKVLKTGLAVVEYLRLKGEMGPEQILEISKILNIPEAKLKSLYQ